MRALCISVKDADTNEQMLDIIESVGCRLPIQERERRLHERAGERHLVVREVRQNRETVIDSR